MRTVYTKEELKQLESIFTLQTQYPDLLMQKQIAERFGITERKIHVSRILSISSASVFQVAYFMLNKIYPFPPPELVSEQKSEAKEAHRFSD